MEKSSGHDENNSDEFLNFEPPSKVKRFANLSERELNDLVEKRHSDKTKKSTNWSVSTFRGEYVQ